jgi:orotidine-5'-phosphate decarboxylase
MDRPGSCAGLLSAHHAEGRHLVVGLDTDPRRIPATLSPSSTPAERVVEFNRRIVEHTADLACAYKPNAAFYEALGAEGFRALRETIEAIRALAPEVPVIVDAKRADIGSTNSGYVKSIFDELGADAITVHPYLGREALEPFLQREEKLIFVLARTSNPGAGEFQDLLADGVPLYRHVARAVASDWNAAGNCGLVVGATYPEELRQIRQEVPASLPILVPGVGTQGGDLGAVVAAHREVGSEAFLVNASRSILYASPGTDFAEAARAEALSLSDAIRVATASPRRG